MVRDAYKFSAPPFLLALVAAYFASFWLAGLFLFLALFVLYFFRDPHRTPPDDPAAVVSPADGRIVAILDESFNGVPGRRISIFLSVWDVHVNRSPVAGRIEKIDYRPGRFYAALRERASAENEQNVFLISTPRGEMYFKQIAGWIARRVIAWKKPGDAVTLGERVGMIRFGSRSDVWLPASAEILVRCGQSVAGGSSVLARWQ